MVGAADIVSPTENLRLADGVAVGRSLVCAADELLTVLLANFSDEAWKIPVGAELDTCEEVERTEEPSGNAETATVGPLPDFLEDLPYRSFANLTGTQVDEMRRTLTQVIWTLAGLHW